MEYIIEAKEETLRQKENSLPLVQVTLLTFKE